MSDLEQMVWRILDGEMVQMSLRESLTRMKERREFHLKCRKDWFAQWGDEDPCKDKLEAFYDDVDEALK